MNGLTRPPDARRRRVVVRPCWWVPLLIIPQRLDACAVCFGRSDSPLAEAMNRTSLPVPPGTSEFGLAGLTPLPCRQVKSPRVGESPVAMECRLLEIIRLKTLEGRPVDGWLGLGQVVGVHIDRRLIRDGVYQTAEAHPILRAGGLGAYAEITPAAMFDMPRGV